MQYFINMAGAEEELYKKWKEITLNSTGSDQVCLRTILIVFKGIYVFITCKDTIFGTNVHYFYWYEQAKYRVWDYPVKEQYTHILRVIEQTGPVDSPEEGIAMVGISKTA